jgi:hypothetical protein
MIPINVETTIDAATTMALLETIAAAQRRRSSSGSEPDDSSEDGKPLVSIQLRISNAVDMHMEPVDLISPPWLVEGDIERLMRR